MNTSQYTLAPDLLMEVECPVDGILSRPIFSNERMCGTLFALSAGQEMTEHTTSMEAVLHVLEGEIILTANGEIHDVGSGAWLHMMPRLLHSLVARTGCKFYLVVLR